MIYRPSDLRFNHHETMSIEQKIKEIHVRIQKLEKDEVKYQEMTFFSLSLLSHPSYRLHYTVLLSHSCCHHLLSLLFLCQSCPLRLRHSFCHDHLNRNNKTLFRF